MQLGAMIAVMLMISMSFVPAVSAEIYIQNTGINVPASESKEIFSSNKLEEIPSFQPGILDKTPYVNQPLNPNVNKEQLEFICIAFSQVWLDKNDDAKEPELVNITIPEYWLTTVTFPAGVPAHIPAQCFDKIPMNSDELIAILWMPKNLINIESKENSVTLNFPEDFLLYKSNITEAKIALEKDESETRMHSKELIHPPIKPFQVDNTKTINTEATFDYQERTRYYRKTLYSITGVTGKIDPISYSNQGETFTSYHEIEIYLNRDGDIIEFVNFMRNAGHNHVFVAQYDEYISSTPLDVDISGLDYVEYYLYLESGTYWVHIRNPVSGTLYTGSYDDTDNPATRVNWLTGSTELYTDSIFSNYFNVDSDIVEDWTRNSNGNWYRPKTTFSWHSSSSDQQYVDINTWFDSTNKINTNHLASSTI